MIDLVAAMETAAGDPLVIALGLLVLGVVVARLLFKTRPRARAITRCPTDRHCHELREIFLRA
jgi:hypothetical protein